MLPDEIQRQANEIQARFDANLDKAMSSLRPSHEQVRRELWRSAYLAALTGYAYEGYLPAPAAKLCAEHADAFLEADAKRWANPAAQEV